MVIFKYKLISFIMFSLCTQTAQQCYQSLSQQQATYNAMKCQQLPVLRSATQLEPQTCCRTQNSASEIKTKLASSAPLRVKVSSGHGLFANQCANPPCSASTRFLSNCNHRSVLPNVNSVTHNVTMIVDECWTCRSQENSNGKFENSVAVMPSAIYCTVQDLATSIPGLSHFFLKHQSNSTSMHNSQLSEPVYVVFCIHF